MVRYTKAEIERDASWTLPDGTYSFVVKEAADAISKKGNDMIAIKLQVDDGKSNTIEVRDWLAFAKKCRDFCRAVGLQRKLEADPFELLAHECVGLVGRLKLTTNENGFNMVDEYVEREPPKAKTLEDLPADAATDDIPF